MPWTVASGLRQRVRHRRQATRLSLEVLEARNLLTATTWPGLLSAVAEIEPNDTVSHAQDLGSIGAGQPAAVVGAIGNSPTSAADVDWYQFTLPEASHVTVATLPSGGASSLVSALGLYVHDAFGFNQPFDSLDSYRPVEQSEGSPEASLTRDLAAGTYWVAVSGAYPGAVEPSFNPLIAGSGPAGSTGPYALAITATPLGLPSSDGPHVLATDPAPGAVLSSSPFVVRIDLSTAPDSSSVVLGTSVNLTYNPTGSFGQGQDTPVALANFDINADLNELRLAPAAPLAPGYYQLFLSGNSQVHPTVLTANGIPLGTDAAHPFGQDLDITFQVIGTEGRPGTTPDDTPQTAQELGDLTQQGLVQVPGAIGVNPADGFYNGADINVYHFQVSGTGHFALAADVFAGRIGSYLNPGLSLFRYDPAGSQHYVLVTANDDSLNPTPADVGNLSDIVPWPPLSFDPSLYSGLTAGDYYLVVSSSGNVPDPALGLAPGVNGIFDLNRGTAYSGSDFLTTGPYVLNVLVQPLNDPPQVLGVTSSPAPASSSGDNSAGALVDGSVLPGPPAYLTVQFDQGVNLQELAYQAYQASLLNPGLDPHALAAVFVSGPDGTVYHPRLVGYDAETKQATFEMLSALPAATGWYELHLSGANGLTNLADIPLAGNDPSGDYVLRFQVGGPLRGTEGDPTVWQSQGAGDPKAPQVLGPLFPDELASPGGVTVRGTFPGGAGMGDVYQVQFLQTQTYFFLLDSTGGLPSGLRPDVYDAAGHLLTAGISAGDHGINLTLAPGTYLVRVPNSTPTEQASGPYELHLSIQLGYENPTPLTTGPAPTFRFQLVTAPTTTPTTSTPATTPRVVVVTPGSPTSGSDIVPAAAPAPRSSPLATATTPTSVLLTLTAGPVGGVTQGNLSGTSPAASRVLVNGPELVLKDRLLQVAVLTGVDGVGGAGDAESSPTGPDPAAVHAALEQFFEQLLNSWRGSLDTFFSTLTTVETPPSSPAGVLFDVVPGATGRQTDAQQEAAPAARIEDRGSEVQKRGARAPRSSRPLSWAPSFSGSLLAWLSVCMVVCLSAPLSQRWDEERRRHPPRGREASTHEPE